MTGRGCGGLPRVGQSEASPSYLLATLWASPASGEPVNTGPRRTIAFEKTGFGPYLGSSVTNIGDHGLEPPVMVLSPPSACFPLGADIRQPNPSCGEIRCL